LSIVHAIHANTSCQDEALAAKKEEKQKNVEPMALANAAACPSTPPMALATIPQPPPPPRGDRKIPVAKAASKKPRKGTGGSSTSSDSVMEDDDRIAVPCRALKSMARTQKQMADTMLFRS
jgi:hypothetical protein